MRKVVVDTSVLINFLLLDRLDLLGALAGLAFLLPREVVLEVRRDDERAALRRAMKVGWLASTGLHGPEELRRYTEYRTTLAAGESACLAIAQTRRWFIACDEKGAFRRKATDAVGIQRILTTPGLLLRALKKGLISLKDADHAKTLLEQRKFRMAFGSFEDLLNNK